MKFHQFRHKKWVAHPKDEPPVKGGQNEALSRTYSEMAHLYRTIVVKEPTWYKMVTTC